MGSERLTVEAAFHDIDFFEICKTHPFGRNATLKLVLIGSIWVVGPELQRLERAWSTFGKRPAQTSISVAKMKALRPGTTKRTVEPAASHLELF